MSEPDWRAIAELQNAAMKKVYFVVGDDIDAIYHSGGDMNEYGAALQMYKEAVSDNTLPHANCNKCNGTKFVPTSFAFGAFGYSHCEACSGSSNKETNNE